jgi:hypothetical protein
MIRLSAAIVFLTMGLVGHADTILLTLDSNFAPPDYEFYSYTSTSGTAENNIPISPYITYLSGGPYNKTQVYSFCYDFNSPTNVGTAYSGSFVTATDTATLEATYLINQLNGDGLMKASLATRGAISLAIWEIMNPSSTTKLAKFPSDPAAQPWEAAAAKAVSQGTWTAAYSSRYPLWVPSNPSIQRFGIVFQNEAPVPEPSTVVPLLLCSAAIFLAGAARRLRPAKAALTGRARLRG